MLFFRTKTCPKLRNNENAESEAGDDQADPADGSVS